MSAGKVQGFRGEAIRVSPPGAVLAVKPVEQPVAAEKDQFYFSSVSTRARIDRFFNEAAPAALVFDFVSDGPLLRRASSVALQTEHRQVPDRVSFGPDTPGKNTGKQNPEKIPYRSDIDIQRIFYEPIVDGRVLMEALKIDFDRLAEQNVSGKADLAPNVMLRPDGQFILRPFFREMGVTEMTRPRLAAFLQILRNRLPERLFSSLIRIGDDGTVILLNRWKTNPTRFWVDKDNRRLKPFHLEKLANGVIADVRSKEPVGIFMGSEAGLADKSLRRIVKEKLLETVDTIERDGYVLKLEPLAPPPAPIDPVGFALALGGKNNPFAAKLPEEKEKPVTL